MLFGAKEDPHSPAPWIGIGAMAVCLGMSLSILAAIASGAVALPYEKNWQWFSFATSVLGDPQFKSESTSSLLVDVWAEALPASLEVSVAVKFFQPGQTNYKAQPKFGEVKDGWVTLRLPPIGFHDDKGTPLASWKDVDFLCFSGTSDGLKRTVFKNLRWENFQPTNP